MKIKYPRTFHLPMSPGATSDDKMLTLQQMSEYFDGREVVISEKKDGECTSIYFDGYHARSLDSRYHESRSMVSRLAAEIGYTIPDGYRICGENLQAVHSIAYDNLDALFLAFSVWDKETCLSYDETKEFCDARNVHMVPVLYRGSFDVDFINKTLVPSLNTDAQEGFVVRLADSFQYSDFFKSVCKWVRPNHVTTDEHWSKTKMIENKTRIQNAAV